MQCGLFAVGMFRLNLVQKEVPIRKHLHHVLLTESLDADCTLQLNQRMTSLAYGNISIIKLESLMKCKLLQAAGSGLSSIKCRNAVNFAFSLL